MGSAIDTLTSHFLLDVAYIGKSGSDEKFYVIRESSIDVFEFWWNSVTYAGDYQGVVTKYNHGSNFYGFDREWEGAVDDLIGTTATNIYTIDGSSEPAVFTSLYGPVSSGEFSGIAAIGDIDDDSVFDYVTTRNVSGDGRVNIVLSHGGYSLGTDNITATGYSYTGIAALGDPDFDSFFEFVVVGTNSDGSGRGYIWYVETDIPFEREGMCDGQSSYPVGDLNMDCKVDFIDMSILASSWVG